MGQRNASQAGPRGAPRELWHSLLGLRAGRARRCLEGSRLLAEYHKVGEGVDGKRFALLIDRSVGLKSLERLPR